MVPFPAYSSQRILLSFINLKFPATTSFPSTLPVIPCPAISCTSVALISTVDPFPCLFSCACTIDSAIGCVEKRSIAAANANISHSAVTVSSSVFT